MNAWQILREILLRHRICAQPECIIASWHNPFPGPWYLGSLRASSRLTKAPSTLRRFQTKTELFCSGYSYRPHCNAENDHRKRSHWKTLSRVDRFENDAFWKRCFLVWTKKTMLSENGDIIKIDTTGRQTGITLPCGFNFAPISRGLLTWFSVLTCNLEIR